MLLNFRYVSDGGVNEGGLLIDDIAVGGTVVSDGSNLDAFKSPTQIRATDSEQLQREGDRYRPGPPHRVAVVRLQRQVLASRSTGSSWLLLSLFPQVVVMVAYDEPTEQVQQYAPYTLTVNGVLQPGGGGA